MPHALTSVRSSLILCGLMLATCRSDPPPPGQGLTDPLPAIIGGWHRSAESRGRDAARHPLETLRFFGLTPALKPQMKIVELWPGGGWYAQLLAPLARAAGAHYVAATTDPDGPKGPLAYRRDWATDLEEMLTDKPAVYGKVEISVLAPPGKLALTAPGTADLVLTFRNLHNWYDEDDLADVLSAVHRALKPGGIFGVVDHRAPAGADPKVTAPRGYLPEAWVIDRISKAGFELVEKSEINANPKDPKDHPKGVWMLPPALRWVNGEEARARYRAIGESDRMTLKFRKRDRPAAGRVDVK